MGSVPMWYRVIRAARYLGVAPWDLASQPVSWLEMAEAARSAEAAAEKAEHEKQQRKR